MDGSARSSTSTPATEGGGTFIFAEEWLKKPGSVGKPADPGNLEIRDDSGKPVTQGSVGTVWFHAPARGRFEYWKDAQKTQSSYDGDWFTMRDMGYQDEDGYVFLTGRTAELIISGGVNIYPAEIDAVILMHPAVADAAAVGVPNEEFGEEVKAVVQLADGYAPSGRWRASCSSTAASGSHTTSVRARWTSMQSSRAATRARCSAA